MTLPVTIHIGDLGGVKHHASSREIRFVAASDLHLHRLHVERAPRASSDQRAISAVLSDLDQQLLDTDPQVDADLIARLVAQRDDLVGQMIDRAWEPTRQVAIEALLVDAVAPMIGSSPAVPLEPQVVLDEPGRAARVPLSIASNVAIRPQQRAEITVRPQRVAFRPERFMISNAGTPGGAGDWIVEDIFFGQRSQLSQTGEIPGEVFATNAIDAFVSFETVQTAMDVRVAVRYVGPVAEGVPFRASMVGTAANGWEGLRVSAGSRVQITIKNLGEEGEFRAVWLAEPGALMISAEQQRELMGAWQQIVGRSLGTRPRRGEPDED